MTAILERIFGSQLVDLFNPNHDQLGRFASGGGGVARAADTGASGGGATNPESDTYKVTAHKGYPEEHEVEYSREATRYKVMTPTEDSPTAWRYQKLKAAAITSASDLPVRLTAGGQFKPTAALRKRVERVYARIEKQYVVPKSGPFKDKVLVGRTADHDTVRAEIWEKPASGKGKAVFSGYEVVIPWDEL